MTYDSSPINEKSWKIIDNIPRWPDSVDTYWTKKQQASIYGISVTKAKKRQKKKSNQAQPTFQGQKLHASIDWLNQSKLSYCEKITYPMSVDCP